ncbi:MAG: hypothetical protein ABI599_15695 [Flavobacteriales bacterium]
MATPGIDEGMACEAYDAYALTMQRVLLQVVQCEKCASALMHHALLKDCTRGRPQPSLTHLLRTAFTFACAAPDGAGEEVSARITAWYLEGSVTSSLPVPLTPDPLFPVKGAA